MFMVVVKRQIPGIGPTKVCEFPRDINDLDEAEKELDWLFRIFTKNNYELESRDWNFPRNSTMIFEKKLTAQTPNIDWEDVWIITLEPCVDQETITKHINSALIK